MILESLFVLKREAVVIKFAIDLSAASLQPAAGLSWSQPQHPLLLCCKAHPAQWPTYRLSPSTPLHVMNSHIGTEMLSIIRRSNTSPSHYLHMISV